MTAMPWPAGRAAQMGPEGWALQRAPDDKRTAAAWAITQGLWQYWAECYSSEQENEM